MSHTSAWAHRLAIAEDTVRDTLRRLPAELRVQAEHVLVKHERRVPRDQLDDGVEPDTMGLFLGCSFAEEEQSSDPLPPRILLFLDEIWDEAEGDAAVYRDEVRRTYLHELGHYLGFDEDGLADRGLE